MKIKCPSCKKKIFEIDENGLPYGDGIDRISENRIAIYVIDCENCGRVIKPDEIQQALKNANPQKGMPKVRWEFFWED